MRIANNMTKPERVHREPPGKTAITFALVGATEPGNAGAAARSLAAFGFHDLRLIAPGRRPGHRDSARAVRWGRELLRNVEIVTEDGIEDLLSGYDEVWGTSARTGRHRPITSAAAAVAAYLHRGGKLLILFGPERDGLSRDWLDRCHQFIRFPTSGGPLNLAHAVTVMAYEIRRQLVPAQDRRQPASTEQRREILNRARAALTRLKYPTRSLRRHPPEAFLEPLRSGPLSRAQARWLLGLLTRLERVLDLKKQE
jgi:tRNA C32,U32 (ribose-2'-O)-methylase TrmJ